MKNKAKEMNPEGNDNSFISTFTGYSRKKNSVTKRETIDDCTDPISIHEVIGEFRERLLRLNPATSHQESLESAFAGNFIAEVGRTLSNLRNQNSISFSDLAFYSGLSLSTISSIESGQSPLGPRMDSLLRFLIAVNAHDRISFNLIGLNATTRSSLVWRGNSALSFSAHEDPRDLSARLISCIREMSGLSQGNLEKNISKPKGFLSKIENKKFSKGITMKTLHLISTGAGFHISVQDLKS